MGKFLVRIAKVYAYYIMKQTLLSTIWFMRESFS